MAKRLTARLSAGAALVTGLGALGVGLMAAPAQAATVTQTYDCTYSVLNVGDIDGNPAVTVELTADIPATAEVGDEIASDVSATVTIPDERRDSLYGLLGVRQIDAPDAETAASEDGGLNTSGARNKASFSLSDGTESVDGDMALSAPKSDVPASGDLTVTATGAIEPVELTQAGTYTITAGAFQAYIRGYGENGDYKTNITLDCTNTSADKTVATVEVTEGSDPEPTDPEPTDPSTSDPSTSDPSTSDPSTSDPSTSEPTAEANDWFSEPSSLPITEDGKHFTVEGTADQAGTINVVLLDKDKKVLRTIAWDVTEGSNTKDFPFAEGTDYVRLVSEDCVDAAGNDGSVAGGCNVEYYAPWVNPDSETPGDDDGSDGPETPGVVQTDGFTRVEQPAGDNNAALLLGGVLLAGAGAGSVVLVRRRQSAQH